MAENILNISLKDYREQIKELQAALLNLTKGTEEYDKVANECRDKQNKLNEVLRDSKNGVDIADNSMNALKQRLSELKKEVGNLDMGSEKFKSVSAEILEVNNKLKEAEAQMGIFGRNVGNYTNSIIEAFGKMGVNLGPIGPLLNEATKAGGNFKAQMANITNLMKTNVIFLAISAAVGAFMKLKSAVQGNEETSRKWSKAMSTFEPILNGINNAIDWLATQLVNVVAWVSSSIPKVTKLVGSASKVFFNVIGGIVDALLYIPKQADKALTAISDIILGGVSKIAEGISGLLEKIGLDDFADGLRSAAKKAVDFGKLVKSVQTSIVNNGGDWVRSLGTSFDGMMKSLAESSEYSMQLEAQRQQLADEGRKRQLEGEQSLLKQQKLRDQISVASGEEKLRLQKELKNEIIANGKKEVEYAKKAYDIKYRESQLTANSAKDNQELVDLKTKVVTAEANYYRELVRVDKQITTNENSINKSTEATKKNTKATKENAEAIKEIIRNYEIYTDEINNNLKRYNDAENLRFELVSNSIYGASDEEKNNHVIEAIQAQIDATESLINIYKQASEDTRLSEEERLKNTQKYNELILKKEELNNKKQIEIQKQSTARFKKEYEERIKAINEGTSKVLGQNNTSLDYLKNGISVNKNDVYLWISRFHKGYDEYIDKAKRRILEKNPLSIMQGILEKNGQDKTVLQSFDENEMKSFEKVTSEFSKFQHDVEEIVNKLPKNIFDDLFKGVDNESSKYGLDFVVKQLVENVEKLPQSLQKNIPYLQQWYDEVIEYTYTNLPKKLQKLDFSELFSEIQNADFSELTDMLKERLKPIENTIFDFDFSSLESISDLPNNFAMKFSGLSDEAKKVLEPEFTNIKKLLGTYTNNMFQFDEKNKGLDGQLSAYLSQYEEQVKKWKEDNKQLEGESDEDYTKRAKEAISANTEVIEVLTKISNTKEQLEQNETEFLKQQYEIRGQIQENAIALKKKEVDVTKKANESIKNSTLNLAKSTASLMGSVADIMENNIDQKVKNGQISEELAEKEFERVKKVQIAQTIINTLAGAVGAYLQDMKSYPSPWNAIIGGIDMASALAMGYAQVQQIKNTDYGSTSTSNGGGGAVVGANVNPLLNEELDERSMDTLRTESSSRNSRSDTRVWISQTDLENSSNQVEIRESQTTF